MCAILKYTVMAGIIASLVSGCAPVKKPDETLWSGSWNTGTYYAPPETDL